VSQGQNAQLKTKTERTAKQIILVLSAFWLKPNGTHCRILTTPLQTGTTLTSTWLN